MMHQLFYKGNHARVGLIFSLLVLLLCVASCGDDDAANQRPAPPVTVAKPLVGAVAE